MLPMRTSRASRSLGRYVTLATTAFFSATAFAASCDIVLADASLAASAQQQVAVSDSGLVDPASRGIPDAVSKPGYELVFSDEFNGSSINGARWNTQLRWDGEFNGERFEYRLINGEDQFYVNVLSDDPRHLAEVVPLHDPFQFNGSTLAIRAALNPKRGGAQSRTYGQMTDMLSRQTFLSGALTTYDKFATKYGYYEARIKIPAAEGTFPAFWLHHQDRVWDGSRRTEIDIMENLGHAPYYIYNSFHHLTDSGMRFVKPQPSGQYYDGTDFSQNFHTYAVKWEPGKVTWYIDDQPVSEMYNDAVNYEDLYIILNLAMGGNWTNFPTSAGGNGRPSGSHFPNEEDIRNFGNPALEIDYVRVYKATGAAS